MKKLIALLLVLVGCLTAQAASPSFTAFSTPQFSNNGTSAVYLVGTPTNSPAALLLGTNNFTGTNNFNTNGVGANVIWLSPTLFTVTGATVSGSAGAQTVTGSAGAFSFGLSAQSYGRGFQVNILYNGVNNDQYWIQKFTDSTHITVNQSIQHSFTNATFVVNVPTLFVNDTTPNVQAGIEPDGTFWTASGNVSQNGVGGGYYMEDGAQSSWTKHLNMGGKYGEAWGIYFVPTHNGFPSFFMSTSTPASAIGGLSSGVLDLQVGIQTEGTSTGVITATGFNNTTGTNIYVSVFGAAVAVTIKDASGTAWATNTVAVGGAIIPLQAGGSITAVGGLTGTWHVQ